MNEDQFGDLHAWIEPEIEARLVALVLGEASDFEADELRRMMEERPELRVLKDRLDSVHGLLGRAVKPDDDSEWRLSDDRRGELLEAFGVEREEAVEAVPLVDEEKEHRVRKQARRVAVMVAACLMVAVLLTPLLITKRIATSARAERALSERVTMERERAQKEALSFKSALHQPDAMVPEAQGLQDAPVVGGKFANNQSIGDTYGVDFGMKFDVPSNAKESAEGKPGQVSTGLAALKENLSQARNSESWGDDAQRGRDFGGNSAGGGLPLESELAIELEPPASPAPVPTAKPVEPNSGLEPRKGLAIAGNAGGDKEENRSGGLAGGGVPTDDAVLGGDVAEGETAKLALVDEAVMDRSEAGQGAAPDEGWTGQVQEEPAGGRFGRIAGDRLRNRVQLGTEVAPKLAEVEQTNQEDSRYDWTVDPGKPTDLSIAGEGQDEGKAKEAPGAPLSFEGGVDPFASAPEGAGQALKARGGKELKRESAYRMDGDPPELPAPLGAKDEFKSKSTWELPVTNASPEAGRKPTSREEREKKDVIVAGVHVDKAGAERGSETYAGWAVDVNGVDGVVEEAAPVAEKSDLLAFTLRDQDSDGATVAGDDLAVVTGPESEGRGLERAKDPVRSNSALWYDADRQGGQVEEERSDSYRSAYDETRARQLAEVDEKWERGEAEKEHLVKEGAVLEKQMAQLEGAREQVAEWKSGEAIEDRKNKAQRFRNYKVVGGEEEEASAMLEALQKQIEVVEEMEEKSEFPHSETEVLARVDSDSAISELGELAATLRGLSAEPAKRPDPTGLTRSVRRDDTVDRALESHDYVEAKREYENAQGMLQAMKLQQSSKRIGLKLPKSPVVVEEKPVVRKKSSGLFGLGASEYESRATVELRPTAPDVDPFGGALGDQDQGLTRQFLETERTLMLGEETLKKTAEDLGLKKLWGTDEDGAVDKLRELVSVEQKDDAGRFEITVASKDKAEAKAITEKVVEHYAKRRSQLESERAGVALDALEEELQVQEALVEEKRKVLDTIVQAVGIPYVEGVRGTGERRSQEALYELSERRASKQEAAMKDMEKSVAEEAFSTFSLHVSDVSFKLAQAALAKGEWPEAERVRVEEFVNAFDYGDPSPAAGEKVACQVEQAAHPFMQQRNVMRIAMRTAAVGRSSGTPLRLTILLDNSGSMERADRAESVRNAFSLLLGQLTAEDEVTLISFARTPHLLRDGVSGDKAAELLQVLAERPSEGGTNLEEALRLGMEKATENRLEGAQNRVILLTDGAANLGDAKPERLKGLVETLRQRGIAFDACGVGADGLNDDILEALTRKGDGRYYFLDRPEDADAGFAKQIAGALRPAAKNVKVQVEFNPKRVGHYALYGFEKHELKKEDFRNDSVDAAELAAEEAGVALYHVETLPDGEGDVGTVSVRFQDMETGEMVEKMWPIPYQSNPASLEDAAPSMRLAASAAFLGETLKGSAVGDLVEIGTLEKVARSLQSLYPENERVGHLIEMVGKVREMR